jgi:hypothetical protein
LQPLQVLSCTCGCVMVWDYTWIMSIRSDGLEQVCACVCGLLARSSMLWSWCP